jgi:hypothetical protein
VRRGRKVCQRLLAGPSGKPLRCPGCEEVVGAAGLMLACWGEITWFRWPGSAQSLQVWPAQKGATYSGVTFQVEGWPFRLVISAWAAHRLA